VPDRAEAIALAMLEAKPGDCVLIAGKGHEPYQMIGDCRVPFDDREMARRWLYQYQPAETKPSGRGPHFG